MTNRKNQPGKLVIQEEHINADKGYFLGEGSGWYEPYTDDWGRLFKSLQQEYGRCVSRVYVDAPDRQPFSIGWVFQKKREFEDADRMRLRGQDRYYTHEVWVTYKYV